MEAIKLMDRSEHLISKPLIRNRDSQARTRIEGFDSARSPVLKSGLQVQEMEIDVNNGKILKSCISGKNKAWQMTKYL